MDYSIGAVERILEATGRPVTRHWLQQLKKRLRLWNAEYQVTEGKGRHGDQFPLSTICQIALHYDLTRQVKTHQEAWSKITFNMVTAEMFTEALTLAGIANSFQEVNFLTLLEEIKDIPEYRFMALAVIFDDKWDFNFKYIWDRDKLEDLQKTIEYDSRVTIIFNMSQIAWLVAAAAKQT